MDGMAQVDFLKGKICQKGKSWVSRTPTKKTMKIFQSILIFVKLRLNLCGQKILTVSQALDSPVSFKDIFYYSTAWKQ